LKHEKTGKTFTRIEGLFDIITLRGGVLDGHVHAHLEMAGSNGSFGGHLELRMTVLTFCLVFIAELSGIDLTLVDKY
jgi:predicted DNA-binding protein with PD1-like motif